MVNKLSVVSTSRRHLANGRHKHNIHCITCKHLNEHEAIVLFERFWDKHI